MIVGIYKMHVREIKIKNRVYNYLAWRNRFKQRKSYKKDIRKELMHVTWNPTRCWDWCMPEDEKKVTEPIFTGKVGR